MRESDWIVHFLAGKSNSPFAGRYQTEQGNIALQRAVDGMRLCFNCPIPQLDIDLEPGSTA